MTEDPCQNLGAGSARHEMKQHHNFTKTTYGRHHGFRRRLYTYTTWLYLWSSPSRLVPTFSPLSSRMLASCTISRSSSSSRTIIPPNCTISTWPRTLSSLPSPSPSFWLPYFSLCLRSTRTIPRLTDVGACYPPSTLHILQVTPIYLASKPNVWTIYLP